MAAVEELFTRQGVAWTLDPDAFYTGLEPMLTHFATRAAERWVAEDRTDGSLVGYARSIERGGLRELTRVLRRVPPSRLIRSQAHKAEELCARQGVEGAMPIAES